MENFDHLKLRKDQNVMVIVSHGKFYGKFNKLSVNGSRLDLLDVRDDLEKPCGVFKFFFAKDVTAVVIVSDNGEEAIQEAEPVKTVSTTPRFQMTSKQYAHITEVINNRSFIQLADANYAEAIADISKQFIIGISAEGCNDGRFVVNSLKLN